MTDLSKILWWYRGRARETIKNYVLPILGRCEAQGYWEKGASRKVKAALNKTHRGQCAEAISGAQKIKGDSISVEYGRFERAPKMLAALPDGSLRNDDIGAYATWCLDFAPVGELVAKLDATRPRPEFVFSEISPTVHANVALATGLDYDSVRSPEIVWEKVEGKDERGNVSFTWEPRIKWPEGTKHNASKFFHSGNHFQCQACGHAIRQNNWVPLLLDGKSQTPHSLWVGRDCARHLFGCKVTGEPEFNPTI